jgi:hypothetical protein
VIANTAPSPGIAKSTLIGFGGKEWLFAGLQDESRTLAAITLPLLVGAYIYRFAARALALTSSKTFFFRGAG